MKLKHTFCIGIFSILISFTAQAWENHTALTAAAVRNLPEIIDSESPQVESLESFLQAEKNGLATLLETQESFAQSRIPTYPTLPSALKFTNASGTDAELKTRFLHALRVNPNSKTALYRYLVPGAPTPTEPSMAITDVTLVLGAFRGESPFVALREGDRARAADVVASAADEPDYGLDIGLWSDNKTDFGKAYAFGEQPFGDPTQEFGTQAPFHMGFYHEAKIIYAAAGFLKRTYPELRIYQFLSLAQYAFRTGHDYWGWRFTGWALHYIQDLTQPYHARVLPGVSTLKMLWINILDKVGFHSFKNNRITLVANRHLSLENFEMHALVRAMTAHDDDSALVRTLSDASGDWSAPNLEAFAFEDIRDRISAESTRWCSMTDRALRKNLPREYVYNPDYHFGVNDPEVNLLQILEDSGKMEEIQNLQNLLLQVMKQVGPETRRFIRTAVYQK